MSEHSTRKNAPFGTAEIGALAHLYRGELYRSTVWRTRLDATTNWAVVSTGIALSLTCSRSACDTRGAAHARARACLRGLPRASAR
jgi:uncharacterized membrane protein